MIRVCKSQKVTADDIDWLAEAGYIAAQLGGTDLDPFIGLNKVGTPIQRHLRLRLTASGLHAVLDDPGNQIRYTLGQHDKPISLAKLFEDNTITMDDVAAMQVRGLISVVLPEVGEFEVTGSLLLFGDFFAVSLTPKGREYLPL